LIVAALSVSLSLVAAASPRVAVMRPHGSGAASDDAAVRAAIADSKSLRVLDAAARARLLASAADSGITCDASLAECATRVCAFGGLDFVVVTRLEAARATLALHDCVDGREVRASSALLDDATPSARKSGLASLAHAVLGEGEARGRLAVQASGAGTVAIDGVDRGSAPVTLEIGVGVHEVTWRGADGTSSTRQVEVPAASTATVTFGASSSWTPVPSSSSSSSSSSSPTVQLLAGGGIAVGAAAALVGGVGAVLVAPGDRSQYSAREYNDAVGLGRVLLGVSAGGALLALAAGGALALLDDDDEAP
jgi:hypothetical protein